jgi:amino acid adenylation domain-containing protein
MVQNDHKWDRPENRTAKPTIPQNLIAGWVRQVQNAPERTALICQDRSYTYAEVWDRSCAISAELIRRSFGAGEKAAVSVPRGADMVCAVLAVLLAGGVYVPVSYKMPADRRDRIYRKAGIRFCLTAHTAEAVLQDPAECIFTEEIEGKSVGFEPHLSAPEESAYIIFTSGSTGDPKGVEITHKAAWNTIEDVSQRIRLDPNDRCLQVSALDFDLSVFDVFAMLSCGGSIVLLSEDTAKEPAVWKQQIAAHRVTIWNSVPSLFEMLLTSLEEEDDISSLRQVLLSGDYVMPKLYSMLRQRNQTCRFTALGGATEASIWSNCYEVDGTEDPHTHIPYGKPLANQQFRVMKDGTDAPDGETGELWIGGDGLAKGYIGDPEKTAAAFVLDADGKRWYRTGDLGHYREDGDLIFEGRMDHQVKINGFRIELGEIESQLNRLEGISRSIALVDQSTENGRIGVVIEPETGGCEIPDVPHTEPLHSVSPYDTVIFNWMQRLADRLSDDLITAEMQPVMHLWREKLRTMQCSSILDGKAAAFGEALEQKTELMYQIFTGQADPLTLLEDNLLSPQHLMEQLDPDTDLETLSSALVQDGKAGVIAVVGGRDGSMAYHLLQKIADKSKIERVLYFESSQALLASAEQKLRPLGLPVTYLRTDHRHLRADLAGIADSIISVNGIHLFENIRSGLDWIRLLLREHGRVYMIESAYLSGAGYISAAVIEHGFDRYTDLRNGRSDPMLMPEEWEAVFSSSGFTKCREDRGTCSEWYLYTFEPDSTFCIRTAEQLADACRKCLVYYMVPDVFFYCTGFPLTPNGKVDNRQMQSWLAETTIRTGTKPQTETQRTLAVIWRELLGTEEIFSEDHFFEIGGDSLISTRLLASIKSRFAVTCSMKELFDHPRLCEMADLIDGRQSDDIFEEGEL